MIPKLNKLCRTCLASDPSNELITIYNEEGYNGDNNYTYFAEIIESLTNIMPEKFDGLPEMICSPCSIEIKKIQFFKMKCINSDSVLRKMLMQAEKEKTMLSNDVVGTNHNYHDESLVYKEENTQDNLSVPLSVLKCEEPICSVSLVGDGQQQADEQKPGNILPLVNHSIFEINEIQPMDAIVKEEKELTLSDCSDQNYESDDMETELFKKPNTDIYEENQEFSQDPILTKDDCVSDVKPEVKETNTNETLSLKVHEKSEKKNKSKLKCPKCHKTFMHLARLKRHININTCVDHNLNNGKLIFACLICGKKYNRQFSLQRHSLISHKQKLTKEIIIESIELNSETNSDPKKDKDIQVKEEIAPSPIQTENNQIDNIEAMRQCNICKEIFENDEALAEHKVLAQKHKLHHTEKSHICTICNKAFSFSHNLKIHLMNHKEIKPFKCEQCNQRFVRNSCLNRHLKTHTGDRPFNCEFCNKSFPYMFALKIHERSHTGERPYSCTICSMKFKFANTLKDHQRIHTGEKPHACNLCPRKLSSKKNLRIHMRCHEKTNEKSW